MGGFAPGLKQNELQKRVDWTIDDHAKACANSYYELHRVRDVTVPTLFHGTLFSVLAARQDYKNHVNIYATMLARGYGDPQKIVNNGDSLEFHRCIASASAPNQKKTRIIQLAEWWLQSSVPGEIVADATNGQHRECELRDRFADEVPGVADKGASMLFGHIGYKNCVPIDTWMVRYLREHGHTEFQQPDYITIGGLRREEYHKAEGIMQDHAGRHGMTPFLYQVALWVKATGWMPSKFIDPNTLDIQAQKEFWCSKEFETKHKKGENPYAVPSVQTKSRKMQPMGGKLPIATPEQLLLYNLDSPGTIGAHVTQQSET
jgi:thermostable 8-oxoguanine DNA glycosylase